MTERRLEEEKNEKEVSSECATSQIDVAASMELLLPAPPASTFPFLSSRGFPQRGPPNRIETGQGGWAAGRGKINVYYDQPGGRKTRGLWLKSTRMALEEGGSRGGCGYVTGALKSIKAQQAGGTRACECHGGTSNWLGSPISPRLSPLPSCLFPPLLSSQGKWGDFKEEDGTGA